MIEDEIRRLESKHKELDIAIKKDYSNYLFTPSRCLTTLAPLR